MAKRHASGKLKSLEERLGQLGFMRRAREKLRLEESAKEKAFKGEEVSWFLEEGACAVGIDVAWPCCW